MYQWIQQIKRINAIEIIIYTCLPLTYHEESNFGFVDSIVYLVYSIVNLIVSCNIGLLHKTMLAQKSMLSLKSTHYYICRYNTVLDKKNGPPKFSLQLIASHAFCFHCTVSSHISIDSWFSQLANELRYHSFLQVLIEGQEVK